MNKEEKIKMIKNTFIGSSKIDDMPHGHNISNPQEQKLLLLEKLNEKLESKK